ncbi:hypothetical protein BC940DRAFT_296603 [Gongronella butleri]|nr:hypothetical protein BC940DRAFT_296603 [Gongronella butleri]
MLTELRLDTWLPLFSAAHVDVFQWLAMDRDIHFAAIGIHDPTVRYQLALFARALQVHLNPALAPLQHHGDTGKKKFDKGIGS